MKYIYTVQHVNDKNGDAKHLGSYPTMQRATEVVEKYRKIKGFKDSPNGFFIDRYEVDKEYWQEGYVTRKIKKGPC